VTFVSSFVTQAQRRSKEGFERDGADTGSDDLSASGDPPVTHS